MVCAIGSVAPSPGVFATDRVQGTWRNHRVNTLTEIVLPLVIAGIFLVPAVRWPNVGRTLVGLFFLGGATYNTLVTLADPVQVLTGLVATAPIPPYREVVRFAAGWNIAGVLTLAVIAFEVTAGCLALWRGSLAKLALLAAGAWGLGMLPVIPPYGILLGIALTGAPGIAALLLLRRSYPESVLAAATRRLHLGSPTRPAPRTGNA